MWYTTMMKFLSTRCSFFLLLFGLLFILPQQASAQDLSLNGGQLTLVWTLPFLCMLLSIALAPLVIPHIWHKHFGKISVFWALAFLVPFALSPLFGFALAFHEFLHAILLEYVPFLILIFSLFTVVGGIHLHTHFSGTPLTNTAILFFGTLIASWVGTTGAAILLIQPILKANTQRLYKTHTVVFFIFLVANIGGALTPLGDPPLFLGFLQGVSFFWTGKHLLPAMLFMSISLLILYFLIDTFLYTKEEKRHSKENKRSQKLATPKISFKKSVQIEGSHNLYLLGLIILAVLLSGIWQPNQAITVYGIRLGLQNIARDLLLLCIAGLSLAITKKEVRTKNDFTWEPVVEVAKIFLGIFVSMIPAIAMLKAGEHGAFSSLIALVNKDGQPQTHLYFLLTGILSSFLDNAPTYLVFFNTAGSSFPPVSGQSTATLLMNDFPAVLLAISAGAVFMGANTYIGNAPNFMVRSIAEKAGVPMPSFFGYMVWSMAILAPLFVLLTFFYF